MALTANEAARVFGFYIQEQPVFHLVLFNGRWEAEQVQDFFQGGFGFSRHLLGIVDD